MFKKRAAKKEQVDLGFEKENPQEDDQDDGENVVMKIKKKVKPNNQDDDGENDNQKKVQDLIDAEMEDLKYKSNENMIGNRKDLATVYNEIDTDELADARAIALRRMELSQQKREGKIASDVYLGKNYTTQYTTKSESQITNSKYTGSMGPVRAPANVRMTCRFDYDPSLCKDYHNTGYCVFGDSCLYLHDRGDYKNGQEQEQEWQREQKRKQQALQNGEEEDSEADEVQSKLEDFQVPRECQICDGKLRQPIKTLCNHFFCEDCAIKHYANNKTCFVCERNTQGVFQDATNTIKILEKERKEEKYRLKQTTNSKKALQLLQDTEESDNSQDNFVPTSKRLKKKKIQKNKQQETEVTVERTYIDENGIEITETIIQHKPDNEEDKNQSDDDNDEQSNEEDDELSDNNGNQEDNEEDENNKINKNNKQQTANQQSDERDIQVALNQMNKSKQKNRSFKPSASDWLIQ